VQGGGAPAKKPLPPPAAGGRAGKGNYKGLRPLTPFGTRIYYRILSSYKNFAE